MKKRFLKKATAIFLLLITLESIVQPTLTYALTTGPHQPEYTSYEQPGATDMVNLMTGDFTFSLPILEVPGPDGGFSLPLSYHAGIGSEQEASWVGLGWTLNAGAIAREINQYPDDASSEGLNITMKDLIGISGVEWEIPGFGVVGHNTQIGDYGSLSLFSLINASWGNGHLISGGVIGFNFSNSQLNFDGAQFANGLVTIASFGVAAAEAKAGEELSAVAEQAASQAVGSMVMSKLFPSMSSSSSDATSGVWNYHRIDHKRGLRDSYHILLDETRNEQMYGVLNLDKVPTWSTYNQPQVNINGIVGGSVAYGIGPNYGGTFDMNYYVPPNTITPSTAFRNAQSPAVLGYDYYKVMASGISGSIKPYRMEVGSVAMPQQMTSSHQRNGALPYMGYKVPFIYDGSESNSYINHNGNSTPTFNYGLSFSQTNVYSPTLGQVLTDVYTLNDPTFSSGSRIKASQTPGIPGYTYNPWCYNCANNSYTLPQANHVEWLSTKEIINTAGTFTNGFMDYFSGASRSTSRNPTVGQNKIFYSASANFTNGVIPLSANDLQNFSIGQQISLDIGIYNSVDRLSIDAPVPLLNQTVTVTAINATPNTFTVDVSSILSSINGKYCWITINCLKPKDFNSIGGYSITSADGRTYHFALPISDYQSYTRIGDAQYPNDKYSEITRNDQFANTWLLTGITGPDFIDRNNNGAIDASDWGYWIKLNYGKYSGNYQWRIPFGINTDTPSPDGAYISHTQGNKELYYLNSIETRSHVALFLKDQRNDGYDATFTNGTLKLSEISLLRRQDYYSLLATPGIINDSGTTNSFWAVSTWAGSNTAYSSANVVPSAFISQNALKRVKFSYDYSLCKSTLNSKDLTIDANGKSGGKLTLSRVSMVGRNNAQVVPDYKFAYGNGNPTYDPNKWDAWGLYNPFGTSAYSTHAASLNDADGASWSLSQITTPQGSTINVNYERDKYASISGMNVTPSSINGGGIRVGSIILSDQGQSYKSRYLYTKDDGTCSGVLAQEPAYAKTSTFDFATLPGYPVTPVIYSQVSVLSGRLTTDTDFDTKQVYQFETPDLSLFTINTSNTTIPYTSTAIAYAIKNEINDNTAKIGSVKSIRTYNNSGGLVSSTSFGYTNSMLNNGVNNYQGLFSEGTLMHDYLYEGTNLSGIEYTKMTRTTSIKYPYALQSILTQQDGFISETDNVSWDIFSAQVVEKNNISASGIKTKTVTQPAYSLVSNSAPVYSQMGPKALNSANKNMLTQPAAEYAYRLDALGNITGLISGQAITWNNSWLYRDFDVNSSSYLQQTSTDFYRQYKSYVYKGAMSDLQADGSLRFNTSTNVFDFTGSTGNTNWQQTGTTTRYDHFSLPIESQNAISGIFSSSKRDFNNMFILASASNAGYFEFAYSGAEDGNNSSVFFGGEVARGNGSVVTGTPGTTSHTGQAAVQVTPGNYSFIYKPVSLTPNRTYRAQVWTNSLNGAVYYKVNGAAATNVLPISTNKAGNWYKIIADITIPSSFTSFEVGVTSTSGTVTFDDFRFQPRDGSLQANVYDASTGYLTYTLGNDNLYTRYYYDDRGIVMKTYVESIKYNGERLVSERKDDYKRNHSNQ